MKENNKIIKKVLLTAVCVALAGMTAACGNKPDLKEVREKAVEYYQAGDYQAALDAFDEALELDRGKVGELQLDILRYRGECELRLGMYEEAGDTYDALLIADKDKDNKRYYEELIGDLNSLDEIKAAVLELEAGNYEEAYAVFDSYAKLDGTLKGKLAWFNQGVCAEYMHRYDEAYELFNQYLKVYPEDEEAIKEMNFLKTR